MIDHLARCRAVVFPPFNEDYGFVTVEAFMCGKPVITCSDSGGPAELVRDGESGFCDRAHARSDRGRDARAVMDDRNLAARMGEAGARVAAAMTWPDAVRRLLAEVHFSRLKLSVVMPAYNEQATIRTIVARVLAVDLGPIEKELVIVDDGSKDGTRDDPRRSSTAKTACACSSSRTTRARARRCGAACASRPATWSSSRTPISNTTRANTRS